MFTSLDTFFNDYCVKNNQFPNETVLNRSTIRLKREIRELKSILDIIQGKEIEEWNPDKIYEIDEYVQYNGLVYRSMVDTNYAMKPSSNGWWKQEVLPSISKYNELFNTQTIISEENQREFFVNFNLISRPAVFVDGIFQDFEDFTFTKNSIILNTPLQAKRHVSVMSGVSYETLKILPRRQFVATQDQYIFDVPFELTEPMVFIDGILQDVNDYMYSTQSVELKTTLNEGQIVVICNGANLGIDVYSKNEIIEKLKDYYLKSEVYTKEEVDALDEELKNEILNNDIFARKGDYYDKKEIDNKLIDYASVSSVDTKLNAKANWGSSLKDYKIENAYTIDEVDALVDTKLDKDQFTTAEILNLLKDSEGEGTGLNADTLKGIAPEQFMRSDRETNNVGGIKVKDDVTPDVTLEIDPTFDNPKFNINRKVQEGLVKNYTMFNQSNSNGLIFEAEGDFLGTWWVNIHNFGIVNPKDYKWVVHVQPLSNSKQFDFIPKNYGSGFEYKAFNFANTNPNDGSFNYGFLDGDILKFYSYIKENDNTFKKSYAHYKLIGYHKSICTQIFFNQGDEELDEGDVIDYIQFYGVSNKDFSEMKNNITSTETPIVPNVNDDNALQIQSEEVEIDASTNIYTSNIKKLSQPDIWVSSKTISPNQEIQIYISDGLIGKKLDVSVEGDCSLDHCDTTFNQFGEFKIVITGNETINNKAIVKITSWYYDDITLEFDILN